MGRRKKNDTLEDQTLTSKWTLPSTKEAPVGKDVKPQDRVLVPLCLQARQIGVNDCRMNSRAFPGRWMESKMDSCDLM